MKKHVYLLKADAVTSAVGNQVNTSSQKFLVFT